MSSSHRCGYKRLPSLHIDEANVARDMSIDRAEREHLHGEPENIAVENEARPLKDATSSTSEQHFAIEISDSEDEIISLSNDDEDDASALDGFANIVSCATFSIAECFPNQEHVKRMNVLMMVNTVTLF